MNKINAIKFRKMYRVYPYLVLYVINLFLLKHIWGTIFVNLFYISIILFIFVKTLKKDKKFKFKIIKTDFKRAATLTFIFNIMIIYGVIFGGFGYTNLILIPSTFVFFAYYSMIPIRLKKYDYYIE